MAFFGYQTEKVKHLYAKDYCYYMFLILEIKNSAVLQYKDHAIMSVYSSFGLYILLSFTAKPQNE